MYIDFYVCEGLQGEGVSNLDANKELICFECNRPKHKNNLVCFAFITALF